MYSYAYNIQSTKTSIISLSWQSIQVLNNTCTTNITWTCQKDVLHGILSNGSPWALLSIYSNIRYMKTLRYLKSVVSITNRPPHHIHLIRHWQLAHITSKVSLTSANIQEDFKAMLLRDSLLEVADYASIKFKLKSEAQTKIYTHGRVYLIRGCDYSLSRKVCN